jgi:phage gp16-like protein
MSPSKQKATSDIRRRDIAMIHIAKKHLCLSDEAYQDILFNVAGVKSSKFLDEKGIKDVLQYLRECGFRPVHKSAKASGMHLPPAHDKETYLAKIASLLTMMEKPWSYADAIARHAFRVDKIRWLTAEQLKKVMIMMINFQKKSEKKEEGENTNEGDPK